jgi:hypothetical protein
VTELLRQRRWGLSTDAWLVIVLAGALVTLVRTLLWAIAMALVGYEGVWRSGSWRLLALVGGLAFATSSTTRS